MSDEDTPQVPQTPENTATQDVTLEKAPESSPPPAATPPPAAGPLDFLNQWDGKRWAMVLHFSQFAGYLVPALGFVAPIVIWQLYKERFPELEAHGKMVTNWLISMLIYAVAAWILSFVTCGIGAVLFLPLLIVSIVFPILGGIKAGEGVLWKYPITIKFLK